MQQPISNLDTSNLLCLPDSTILPMSTYNMGSNKKTVALVSGANCGIGEAVATQLAKDHRYHAIIGARNAAAGEEVAKAIRAEGFSASSVQLDITSDESIAAAVRQIEREHGVLDVLVNNAGIMLDVGYDPPETQKQSTRELLSQTLNTNVVGTACLTEACLPLLRKSELPRVVFVSSIMGSLTNAGNKSSMYYNGEYTGYMTSKAGVNMLSQLYAKKLEAHGGMVNSVCPGLVRTKLVGNFPGGATPEVGAQPIVELATAAKGGKTRTYTERQGTIPW